MNIGLDIDKIYNESNLDTMRKIFSNKIHLTVTSPPYGTLRSYDSMKSWSFDTFKSIAKELYRITEKGGVVAWIVNDQITDGSQSCMSFKQAIFFKEECGFNLNETIIFEKDQVLRKGGNRYTDIFEYVFILSKGKPKIFNPIKTRCSIEYIKSKPRVSSLRDPNNDDKLIDNWCVNKKGPRNTTKVISNIWEYTVGGGSTPDKIAYKHPATFPEELVRDIIYSYSNPKDIIYDPFAGSGTTLKQAILMDRHWIGSELSKKYVDEIIIPRLKKYIFIKKSNIDLIGDINTELIKNKYNNIVDRLYEDSGQKPIKQTEIVF